MCVSAQKKPPGRILYGLLIVGLCLSSRVLLAQEGDADPNFQIQQVAAQNIALQTDGKVVVFSTSAERLNTDGTIDTTFTGSDESTSSGGVDPTCAGGYTYTIAYNAQFNAYLQRYQMTSGQADTAFDAVTVPGTQVTGYLVLPNGKILVWGDALYRRNADGSVVNALLQTQWRGHYEDQTGFYYIGARYYAPDSGTFLSCDPLGHAASMDLYSAFAGDAVNSFDPDGRFGTQVGASPDSDGGSNSINDLSSQMGQDQINEQNEVSQPVSVGDVVGGLLNLAGNVASAPLQMGVGVGNTAWGAVSGQNAYTDQPLSGLERFEDAGLTALNFIPGGEIGDVADAGEGASALSEGGGAFSPAVVPGIRGAEDATSAAETAAPANQLNINQVLSTNPTTGDSMMEVGVPMTGSAQFIRLNVSNP